MGECVHVCLSMCVGREGSYKGKEIAGERYLGLSLSLDFALPSLGPLGFLRTLKQHTKGLLLLSSTYANRRKLSPSILNVLITLACAHSLFLPAEAWYSRCCWQPADSWDFSSLGFEWGRKGTQRLYPLKIAAAGEVSLLTFAVSSFSEAQLRCP